VDSAISRNFVRGFQFEELRIRGAFVRLREAWQALLEDRDDAPPVARMLGEKSAVTALIAALFGDADSSTL
jgi:molecular chaperone Hsp33